MTEKETAADRAIREALESVERIERESRVVAETDAAPDERTEDVIVPEELHAPPAKKTASDALLEATMKAKQEMQEVLVQTQKEAKDLFDRLARVSADFDNFKKRVNREKADAIKFANEGVFKDMLPVLDNMYRAVQATGDDGVKLVMKQFEDTLTKLGVAVFSALGRPFDPGRHEAVGARPDPTIPAQYVAEEFQRGYMLHDRLLRPALVIVSAGPPPATSAPDATGEN